MKTPPPPLVHPLRALRPAPGRADEVAAPPYDVVNTDEARALATAKPYSFFHISRAEIDLPADADPYSDPVYAAAKNNLDRFERDGVLVRDTSAGFYVYRMTRGDHRQTGIAVAASVEAYLDNRIRKHELTRPAKETDRVRQIDTIGAITGPVFVIHRSNETLSALIATLSDREPDSTVADLDGVRHEVWAVFDEAAVAAISDCFNGMEALYIADGHHRSAAGARVAAARRNANPGHTGAEAYNGFLAVSFPDDEVSILDYNRVVRDLNGHAPEALLTALADKFELTSSAHAVRPRQSHHFGMYLGGAWYELALKSPLETSDAVERLDVRVLDQLILEPLLGIDDPRTDSRIDFIGGSRGPEAVARRVDSGEMAIGFTLNPTALQELMAVADAGRIMPPKSTWFDPKLADGLISLPLDD